MKSLLHQIIIPLAVATFFIHVSASKAALKGTLKFTGLKKLDNLLPGIVSSDAPELVSLLATRDIPDPWILKRQGGQCPPAYPILCPDGIHCTSQDLSVCCEDGVHACGTGGSCCNNGTHCTPAGGFCCGNTACNAGDTCCPIGCAPAGSTCCGSSYYCNEGESCCGAGCTFVDYTCCGTNNQCSLDEQCCEGDPGGCAPVDATCCGPEFYCDSGTLCCVDEDGEYYCTYGPTCDS